MKRKSHLSPEWDSEAAHSCITPLSAPPCIPQAAPQETHPINHLSARPPLASAVRTTQPSTLNYSLLLLVALTICLLLTLAGCKHDYNKPAAASAVDPATVNLAPVSAQPTRVLAQSDSATPTQQADTYNSDPTYDQGTNNGEGQPAANYEQTQAPPPLRTSDQPYAPGPNYIWTPGYWGNGPNGYVWVDGTWVQPPYSGALWTPPYWGYTNSRYRFHQGYWGRHVGYYGGIDYGSGYIGTGYYGGYWQGNDFYYNRQVNHLGGGIRFSYDRPVFVNNVHYGFGPNVRVSYNGGIGGIAYRPRDYELSAMREEHRGPVGIQVQTWQHAGGGFNAGITLGGGGFHDNGRHEAFDQGHINQGHIDQGHPDFDHGNDHSGDHAPDHGNDHGNDHGGDRGNDHQDHGHR